MIRHSWISNLNFYYKLLKTIIILRNYDIFDKVKYQLPFQIIQQTNNIIYDVTMSSSSRGTTVFHSNFSSLSFLLLLFFFLIYRSNPTSKNCLAKSASNTLARDSMQIESGTTKKCGDVSRTNRPHRQEQPFASIENEMPFSNIGNIGQGMKQKS